jgi:hypothetical protein
MCQTDWLISSPLEPPHSQVVRSALSGAQLTEVSAVSLIPHSVRVAQVRGRRQEVELRYPLRVQLAKSDETVYLRSHGTDFNIVPPEWLRGDALSGVYSLGRGLTDSGTENLVLLLQSFRPEHLDDHLPQLLRATGGEVLVSRETEYDLNCLRISASFEVAIA